MHYRLHSHKWICSYSFVWYHQELAVFNSKVGFLLYYGGFNGRENCVCVCGGETLKKSTCVLVELRITDLISLRRSRASCIVETTGAEFWKTNRL